MLTDPRLVARALGYPTNQPPTLHLVVGDRQTGKTIASLRWLLRTPGAMLVVPIESMANYTREQAVGRGIDPARIVSEAQVDRHRGRRDTTEYGYDNLDLGPLGRLTRAGVPLTWATTSHPIELEQL